MLKRVSYYLLLCLLLVPFLQLATKAIKVVPLDGAYSYQERPKPDIASWWSGEFQSKFTKYFDDHIGFRPFFVRSYNQLHYSAFDIAKSPGCVVGKDGQLFLESYINDYTGSNFLGAEVIDKRLDKLHYLKDYLSDNGTDLLLVFAPGKASFHPESIPYRYLTDVNFKSNSNYWAAKADAKDFSCIDLNSHFEKLKGTTPYPLFNKNGVHWSHYGAYLGADSIARFIEDLRNITIPKMTLKNVTMSDQTIDPDNDVEVTMNLFKAISQPKQPHIELAFGTSPETVKPKVLAISDSYYWPIFSENIPQNLFSEGGFWFYFKTAHPEDIPIEEYDIKTKLLEQDVIILMGTEASMHLYPYGFIDKAYEIFMPLDSQSLIAHFKEKIHGDQDWRTSIEQKSEANGISYEEQRGKDAVYMAEKTLEQADPKQKELSNAMDKIKLDSDKMKVLKSLAIQHKSHLDYLIMKEAMKMQQDSLD